MLKNDKSDVLKFQKNVFDELRGIVISDNELDLTDANMIKVITLNENLKSIGFCLKPKDIVRIARSEDIDVVLGKINGFAPEISAKPMYPDFPSQVMEMDEATYRFHQLVHYFSTYGVESLFGVDVKVGWMPEFEETPKITNDKTLLEAKILSVYSESEVTDSIVNNIINKTERFTIPEAELVAYISLTNPSVITSIPFKENIYLVCQDALNSKDVLKVQSLLLSLCKHTGDVFKVLQMHLSATKYKNLSTSIKRVFVTVLESYPLSDFEENIILSLAKKEHTIKLLERLSYNRFSKKSAYTTVVSMLRNKELVSWHQKVERLIVDKNKSHKQVLSFIGTRPGILYRMIIRLYRMGYKMDEISHELIKHVDSYKTQSIISAMNSFSLSEKEEEKKFFLTINKFLLSAILRNKETCLKNKRVYIDTGMYSFEHSIIETNEKSQEGGYIRSGLAFKIPSHVNKLRYFVYWNDKKRIDIDLHAMAFKNDDEFFSIGWNSHYCSGGIVMSGDITHSDAAEYIDINIDVAQRNDVKHIVTKIDSYTSIPFDEIDTIYAGMLAVGNEMDKSVKLYNSKNVFFRHDLKTNYISMKHAFIDVENRVLVPILKQNEENNSKVTEMLSPIFSLAEYLKIMFSCQNVELVNQKEDADFVVSLDRTMDENNISLIDENYFLES